jgi:cytochrome c biogenesis protein CcmG/thiol:disulfide interchange protein DsbE
MTDEPRIDDDTLHEVSDVLDDGARSAPAPRSRTARLAGITVAVLVVGLLGVTAFVALGREDGTPASRLVGTAMPVLRLPDAESGQTFDVAAPGKVLVVNFWAPWCVPCLAEHRMLNAAAVTFDPDRVAVVGIAYQSEPKDISTFLDKVGRNVRSLQDADGLASIDFGVTGVPETFVVDAHGVVRDHANGPVTREQLAAMIDRIAGADVTNATTTAP